MMTMDEMVHGVVHGAGTAHADKHDDRRPDQIGSDLRLVPDFRSPIDSPARVARGRAVARAACRCRGHAGPLCACTWSARRAVYMSTILPTDYCTLGRVRLAPLVAHPRSAALRVRDSIEDCGVILPPESFLKHVHRGRGMIPSGQVGSAPRSNGPYLRSQQPASLFGLRAVARATARQSACAWNIAHCGNVAMG